MCACRCCRTATTTAHRENGADATGAIPPTAAAAVVAAAVAEEEAAAVAAAAAGEEEEVAVEAVKLRLPGVFPSNWTLRSRT